MNTELQSVIESAMVARRIAGALDESIPMAAYLVRSSDSGDLYWTRRVGGDVVRYDVESGASAWQWASVWLMSLLPLEPLL